MVAWGGGHAGGVGGRCPQAVGSCWRCRGSNALLLFHSSGLMAPREVLTGNGEWAQGRHAFASLIQPVAAESWLQVPQALFIPRVPPPTTSQNDWRLSREMRPPGLTPLQPARGVGTSRGLPCGGARGVRLHSRSVNPRVLGLTDRKCFKKQF